MIHALELFIKNCFNAWRKENEIQQNSEWSMFTVFMCTSHLNNDSNLKNASSSYIS